MPEKIDDFIRLQAIMGELPTGVIAVGRDGRVELQNVAASRILGISPEVTLGRPLAECLGPRHPAVALMEDALRSQREVLARGCTLRSRLGSELIVDLSASPIEPEAGCGVLLTLEDHTIGRELENMVDQRNRSEVFAHLASGIAHELGNPLGGIRGTAELLLGKLSEAALRRYPELIIRETDRMRRLLADLGELTLGGELRVRPTNLHRVLDDLLELHGQSQSWAGISVVREYDPSIPELELDPDRITQVFLNLMRNAVQAMGEKGTLTVRTRVDTAYQLSPDKPRPMHMVRTDLEDTGGGIEPEQLPHIFTPFFTRRAEGTGLGLAIAQHWTVMHDGQLQVTSEVGQGTRMRVLLPLPRTT